MIQKELSDFSSTETFPCSECDRVFGSQPALNSHKGQTHPTDRECICDWCDDSFKATSGSTNRFCGRECFHEWFGQAHTGENNPNWVEYETAPCEYCGEVFEYPPSHKSHRRFCSNNCHYSWVSENVYGPNHPLWKFGGEMHRAVRLVLGTQSWGATARDTRERAGRQCEMCGVVEQVLPKKLDAHHIIPIIAGGTHGDYNLMALCSACHGKAEAKAREYTDPVLVE